MNRKSFSRIFSPRSLGWLLALWCGCATPAAGQAFHINPLQGLPALTVPGGVANCPPISIRVR